MFETPTRVLSRGCILRGESALTDESPQFEWTV